MDQLALKLILIAVMFILSVVCGLLPLKLLQFLRKRAASPSEVDEDRRWPSLLLCLVTCFSGGVFLATCFLHLLPEVIEKMDEIIEEYHWPDSYPFAELISCAGFFLVFLIEELVILCLRGHHHHHGNSSHRHPSGSFVHVHVVQSPNSPPGKSGSTQAATNSTDNKHEIADDSLQLKSPACFVTNSDDDEDEKAEMKALTPMNDSRSPTSRVVGRENGRNIVSTGADAEMKRLNADSKSPFSILSPCGEKQQQPSTMIGNGYGHQDRQQKSRGVPQPHQNGNGHSHVHNHNNNYHHHHHEHSHPEKTENGGSGYPPSPSHEAIAFIDGDVPSLLVRRQQNGGVVVSPAGGHTSPRSSYRKRYTSHGGASCASNEDEDGNCPGIELPLNAEPECCEGPCDGRKEDPPIMMAYRPHAHSHGVRSITLVVALSFHSLIEGLAFGIQDTATSTTALFLGIIIHKCIIIFSTGVQLARTHAHQRLLVVVTIVVVSLMSPIGAGVGVAVEQTAGHSEARDVTIMFFSGLSVGTFLYVTFFEVLIHERDNEHNNLWKLFAILIGFILMAGLRAMEDKHSHGGAHQHANTTATSLLATTTPFAK